MKGLDNQQFIFLLAISNGYAILQLISAFKRPRISRILFFILFAWASWMNWKTAIQSPQLYLDYADLTWSQVYRVIITGWFSQHILAAVGFIATCQALIALSMLIGGNIFKIGAVGAMIFLIAILPFGVGSGFPCTAIMAVALFVLLKKQQKKLIWESSVS